MAKSLGINTVVVTRVHCTDFAADPVGAGVGIGDGAAVGITLPCRLSQYLVSQCFNSYHIFMDK